MNHSASAVQRITIEVGPLCGVEPALLARAFDILRVGSCAAQAVLSIESAAISVCCLSCAVQSCAEPNRLVCGACGDFRTRIVAGDELRLRRVELCISEPLALSVH